MLAGAREHFEGARENDEYLRPTKRLLVDVVISKEALDRALEVANVLFLALEARRHEVAFAPRDREYHRPELDERLKGGRERYGYGRWRPARPTIVSLGTLAVGLTLFEVSENVEVKYVKGRHVRVADAPARLRKAAYEWVHTRDMPSGKLALRASSPYPRAPWERIWHEDKPGELPAKARRILRELEAAAPEIAELVAEGERQAEIELRAWEAQQERWRREAEERRRELSLKESRDELFAIIQAWSEARAVEGFFEDAERRTSQLGEDRSTLLDRLQRARTLLGGIDALERFRHWRAPDER
jgi:hypothetical protein